MRRVLSRVVPLFSEDDHRVITYIIANDLATTPLPEGYGGSDATPASDATAQTRAVRQQLVWCVSDADVMHWYPGMDAWLP